MALTLKRKLLVAFVLLKLFEDGYDGFKRGKKQVKFTRTSGEGYASVVVQFISLQDTPTFEEMMRMSSDQFVEILIKYY